MLVVSHLVKKILPMPRGCSATKESVLHPSFSPPQRLQEC